MTPKHLTTLPSSLSQAALFWFAKGYKIIPIVPGEKRPSVKFDSWLSDLSTDKIRQHWKTNPSDEIAVVCEESVIVFDTDTEQSEKALLEVEKELSIFPLLVIKTKKGFHHYYKVPASGVSARSVGFGSSSPGKIDIRYGTNSIAVIAPSTDKFVQSDQIPDVADLTEVSQEFIERINAINGSQPIRSSLHLGQDTESQTLYVKDEVHEADVIKIKLDEELIFDRLKSILAIIHPDTSPLIEQNKSAKGSRDRWVACLAAIFNTTYGSDRGLKLANEWSSRGALYAGYKDVLGRWKSFSLDYEKPAPFELLLDEVALIEPDWLHRRSEMEDPFEIVPYQVVPSMRHLPRVEKVRGPESGERGVGELTGLPADHFLHKHSAVRHLDEMRRNAVMSKPLLFPVVMDGEFTVIYAPPNSGKTLLTLFMVREGIREKRFAPNRVFHLNFDDSSEGAALKTELAECYGFNAIIPGYADASVESVKGWMKQMIQDDSAKGVVFIFDTLKKFTDVMQKSEVSEFTSLCRRFTMKGGTVLALAHTNKNKDEKGRSTPGGTSDVIDDCDCSWTLETKEDGSFLNATFRNIKRRSSVPTHARFRFDHHSPIDYQSRLESVQYLEDEEENGIYQPRPMASIKKTPSSNVDQEVAVVKSIIGSSNETKGRIVKAMCDKLGMSRRHAEAFLNKHAGTDPQTSHWNYRQGASNSMRYFLLEDDKPDR